MMPIKLQKKTKNMHPAKAPKKKAAAPQMILAHDTDGVNHLVGIGNLRVVIVPDGNGFFAQGLEIDYAAQGQTLEGAKTNFEKGFEKTIQQHLQIFGNLKNFLVPAPAPIWQDMLPEKSASCQLYSQVSAHKLTVDSIPYEGIRYLVAAAANNHA